MNKVYVVVEHGGEYEDKWENIVGVCSTPELADELKARVEDYYDYSKCPISEERWNNMWNVITDNEEEIDDVVSSMKQFFPEYSEEDLEKAEHLYDSGSDYIWVDIKEIKFYESLSDF